MTVKLDRRAFVGSALTLGAMCAVNPTQALAVTSAEKQAEVQNVKAQLDAMSEEVSAAADLYNQAMDAYNAATAKVEEAQATIDAVTNQLNALQARLEGRATSMYRTGSMSYLDVLMGAASFDDFATVWDTLNTLNEDDAELVASTKVAKSTLEAAQQELVEQQQEAKDQLAAAEAYMAEVQAKQAEYDSLYNSLSAEYQQLLAAEEAAAAEASARAAQAYSPAVTQAATAETADGGNADGGGAAAGDDGSGESSSGSSSSSSSYSYSSASSLPTNGSVVDYAASRIGCPYVWGASGPDEFDCSGLVAWCYAQIGISLPHYTESMYSSASAILSPDEAAPGDVLYKSGHVGISTGGINAIEAMGSRWGVVESCRGSWTAALRF